MIQNNEKEPSSKLSWVPLSHDYLCVRKFGSYAHILDEGRYEGLYVCTGGIVQMGRVGESGA